MAPRARAPPPRATSRRSDPQTGHAKNEERGLSATRTLVANGTAGRGVRGKVSTARIMRTCVRIRPYTHRLVEYDADRPRIVVANEQHTVDLPDDQDVGDWARERYPSGRFRVIRERQIERWPPA